MLFQFNKLSGDYSLQPDFKTTVLRQKKRWEGRIGRWIVMDGETEWCCFGRESARAGLNTSPFLPNSQE